MSKTQPEPIRDPKGDRLLTPENCVLVLIDFQPEQYSTVTSSTREEIDLNVIALCKLAKAYDVPVIVSTVGVDMGVNEGTAKEILAELPGVKEIDRTGVNSWEDEEFREAVKATGRKKVVIAGLWTEVCLTFPTLDMLAEGFEVYPVADAVGGVSPVSHDRAFDRMIQAGAQPVTAIQFGSELMRNWARESSDKFRRVLRWYFPKRFGLMKEGKIK
ncbi:hydrolase [Paracoccus caeni]|uniref:Hydrolase n=1 Tax=Paracoccus caeni TaxID=657651 RepID=A0A934VZ00_9RHOB|nr:hydrolase [Paracoccus caeni]MBK4214773.1 hydrolase [Paracoccus caeni]